MEHSDEVVRGVIKANVNWRRYAELYRRATGGSERGDREALDNINKILDQLGVIRPTFGFLIMQEGAPRDFLEAYPNTGLKARFSLRKDATALAQALHYRGLYVERG